MKFALKIRPGFLAAALVTLAACSPAAPKKPLSAVATAEKGLMARHDSLMAKTDQLFLLKTKIAATHTPATAPYLRGLAAADAAMMDWMHRYHAPDTTAAPATRLAYYQEQQRVLARIREQFRTTIDSATLFINRHPAPATPARPASFK